MTPPTHNHTEGRAPRPSLNTIAFGLQELIDHEVGEIRASLERIGRAQASLDAIDGLPADLRGTYEDGVEVGKAWAVHQASVDNVEATTKNIWARIADDLLQAAGPLTDTGAASATADADGRDLAVHADAPAPVSPDEPGAQLADGLIEIDEDAEGIHVLRLAFYREPHLPAAERDRILEALKPALESALAAASIPADEAGTS